MTSYKFFCINGFGELFGSCTFWQFTLIFIQSHINPYLAKFSILFLLKTLENFCFFGLFRGYGMRTLTRNAPCLFLCPLKTRIKKKKNNNNNNNNNNEKKQWHGMGYVTLYFIKTENRTKKSASELFIVFYFVVYF